MYTPIEERELLARSTTDVRIADNLVDVIRWMITVMKADAGTADLDVTATSPSGQEIPLQVTPLNDGAEMIEFSPSVPGTYMINVTYGNYI